MKRDSPLPERFTSVRLALQGRRLPALEDAVRVGEAVRSAAIRSADEASGSRGEVPPVLTGHGMGEDNRHGHAFYLPEDADGDGKLDHILIHARGGLDLQTLAAIDRIEKIWWSREREWRVAMVACGTVDDLVPHPYLGPARRWISATPYLHPWYRKRRFKAADQIRRECRERGESEPTVEAIETLSVDGRRLRAVDFQRFRSKEGLQQPDTRGSFWSLVFPKPMKGPIALGFGCHFGLGTFAASGE